MEWHEMKIDYFQSLLYHQTTSYWKHRNWWQMFAENKRFAKQSTDINAWKQNTRHQ